MDATHGGWNDLGAQLYLTLSSFNAILFGVNGYGYTLEIDDGLSELVEEEVGATMALGGRIGVMPTDYFEMGGALASPGTAAFQNGRSEAVRVRPFQCNMYFVTSRGLKQRAM